MRKKDLLQIILIVLLLGIRTMTQSATITVTTTEDNVKGSLRAAITTANSNGENDTINLPAGTYFLTGAPGDENNISGDLDINSNQSISIIGDGAGTTIIDGNQMDRVLHIINGTVLISGVTIRNGKTRAGTSDIRDGDNGGGIQNSGKLTLTNCTLSNNIAGKGYDGNFPWVNSCDGGDGGKGGGVYNNGTLTLTSCVVIDNITGNGGYCALCLCESGSGGDGGGIYNSGVLTLTGGRISNNTTGDGGEAEESHCYSGNGGRGGGIYNEGRQNLKNCTISNNTTGHGSINLMRDYNSGFGGDGGGIYNISGDAKIVKCTIRGNTTGHYESHGGNGGGIYNSSTLTISDSKIISNYTFCGLSHGSSGKGGGIFNSGILILSNSTISSNYTKNVEDNNDAGKGGGIYNEESAALTNCTISSNHTGNGGNSDSGNAGDGGSGGAIYTSSSLTLINCTICNNTTGSGGISETGIDGMPGYGGGIYNNNSLTKIKNTIVANNQVAEGGEGPDCWGELNSQGYNLIKNTSQCNIIGDSTGNIFDKDPKLGALANNGGPTLTHALMPDSPAIDAGNSSGISKDQRGYPRPVDFPDIPNVSDGADIGAYELNSTNDIIISGKITCNGIGLVGVTLTFSNNGGTATTDQNGNYTHYVLRGWSGKVTPSKEDYTFTPIQRNYTSITGNQKKQDYTADLITPSFSLNVQSVPDTGVSISISPNDNNGEGDGNTNFTRLYTSGTTVTLTASVTHNGKEFSKWTIDGTDTTDLSIQVAMNSSHTATACYVTPTPAEIALNRLQFNFGKKISEGQTHAQTLLIYNRGGGTLNWDASPSESWILVNPSSGTGNGEVSISVDGTGLSEGTYTGTITVSDPDVSNSPQIVNVTLKVYSSTTSPFGTFETPLDNSTVRSSIPVTGWVLDDIGVESVKIYRKEGSFFVYIGDAVLVEGARPDVEEVYPGYPNNYKAGWGYMLLTNALPDGGNGTFTLQTKAEDMEGHSITLGTKTIICDNANAVKPFGAIDTPTQGGNASGSNFVNWGWVLTPQPNTIPTDGSTIDVWVDGVNLGHSTYNIYREDIANLFPSYNNSNGAVGYFYLDTTKYENGVHTIAWSAADNAGNKDGIGSRYFSIENSHGAWSMVHGANRRGDPVWSSNLGGIPGISNIPVSYSSPVEVIKGFNRNEVPLKSYPDEKGNITIKIRELQLLEVRLFPVGTGVPFIGAPPGTPLLVCSGFHIVGSQLRPLPIGSTLDRKRGIFYWLPGPAFIGEYRFVFIIMEPNGQKNRKHITINIRPKFCDR